MTCSDRRLSVGWVWRDFWLWLGLLFVLLPAAGFWPNRMIGPDAIEERSFVIIHRPLDEAYNVISPLLSDQAAVLVVRSREPDRRSGREGIAWTKPPRRFRCLMSRRGPWFSRCNVVKGEKREIAEPRLETEGVPRDVRELLGYNAYRVPWRGRYRCSSREAPRCKSPGSRRPFSHRRGTWCLQRSRKARSRCGACRSRESSSGRKGEAVYRPLVQFSEELRSGQPRVLCAYPGSQAIGAPCSCWSRRWWSKEWPNSSLVSGPPVGKLSRSHSSPKTRSRLRRDLGQEGLLHLHHPAEGHESPVFSRAFSPQESHQYRREFSVFNHELATLLKAGLPVLQGLDLLLERMEKQGVSRGPQGHSRSNQGWCRPVGCLCELPAVLPDALRDVACAPVNARASSRTSSDAIWSTPRLIENVRRQVTPGGGLPDHSGHLFPGRGVDPAPVRDPEVRRVL